MSKWIRTASIHRLLATIAGLALAVAGGSAIAVAASGQGPVPPRESLAKAIRQAVAAPTPLGISARISFTNHLINASSFESSDPLLTGATGRLWLSRGHLRLELQADNGDAQIVVSDRSFWIYDPTSKTVYKGSLPAEVGAKSDSGKTHDSGGALPSMAQIGTYLNRLMGHVGLSGAISGDVGGRPAYTVRVTPKESGGLLGAIALGWDAQRGVPLRIAVYARGSGSPVLEVKVTDISYRRVSADVFKLSPPSGSQIVTVNTGALGSRSERGQRHGKAKSNRALGRLSFRLDAPTQLAGLDRTSMTTLGHDVVHTGAVIRYGQGLGTVVVIEQSDQGRAGASGNQAATGGPGGGPSLPTVSIHGTSAQELPTALGTVLRFTRGGVSYTVLGSVPPAVAERVARGL